MSETSKRSYGGKSLADRVGERRDRLIAAAIRVYARSGPEAASVTGICAEAGLTARYFYESFQTRDVLFLAVFQTVRDELICLVKTEEDAEDAIFGGLRRLFKALEEHPDLARLFLVDLDWHEQSIRQVGRDTASKLSAVLTPGARSRLVESGSLGAILQIAREWIEGGYEEPLEEVVAVSGRFAMLAVGA